MLKIKKNFMNSICVNFNMPVNDAIKKLERAQKKILFIVNKKKLIGVVEDSDIRRALIKKKKLDGKIIDIANKRPKFLYKDSYSLDKIKKLFIDYHCIAIPVINIKKEIISIEFNKFFYGNNNQLETLKTAFIMAGGLGKRLRPLTNNIPKPLVKYKKKPIIDHIIENLISNKIETIYISVNYKKDKILHHINKKNYNCKIIFIKEKKFIGTAGSLYFLKKEKIKDVFIINGDLITKFDINSLYKFHKDNSLDFCAVTKLINFQIPYGLVKTKSIYLQSLEEKPTFVRSVLIGAYVLNGKCFKFIKNNKKIDMPDLIQKCLDKKLKIGYYPTYEKYSHVTSPLDLK